MEGRKDFLIRPIEQYLLLALLADVVAEIGVVADKEDDERAARKKDENQCVSN